MKSADMCKGMKVVVTRKNSNVYGLIGHIVCVQGGGYAQLALGPCKEVFTLHCSSFRKHRGEPPEPSSKQTDEDPGKFKEGDQVIFTEYCSGRLPKDYITTLVSVNKAGTSARAMTCDGNVSCFFNISFIEHYDDLTKIDKPFSELNRPTKLRLFEAWLDGKQIEVRVPSATTWVSGSGPDFAPDFFPRNIYRVKNLSEKEKETLRKEREDLSKTIKGLQKEINEINAKLDANS